MPILLDTTVLIDVLRGRPAADRLFSLRVTGEVPYFCAVSAQEVHRGLRVHEVGRATALLAALRIAPLGAMEGTMAGVWEREFRARGVTLGPADCLVAAAAMAVHATIATGNPKDFPMDGVVVQHWPVGE